MLIRNDDYANWRDRMSPEPVEKAPEPITLPRPGHADLAGMQKYAFDDLRNVLERSSARETAARVAAGGVAKKLLAEFGVRIESAVYRIGSVAYPKERAALEAAKADESEVRCPDPELSERMKAEIDAARHARDALGGEFVVVAEGARRGWALRRLARQARREARRRRDVHKRHKGRRVRDGLRPGSPSLQRGAG